MYIHVSSELVSSERFKFAYAPIDDSDQATYPHSLSESSTGTIWVAKGVKHFFMRKTNTLIRQCG